MTGLLQIIGVSFAALLTVGVARIVLKLIGPSGGDLIRDYRRRQARKGEA